METSIDADRPSSSSVEPTDTTARETPTTTPAPTTTLPPTTTTSWGVGADRQLVGPAGMNVDLSACPADWSDTTGVAADRVVIGQTAPLSGSLASPFAELTNAFDAYLARINAEGGINGRRIEVLREDDRYVATQTPAAAARLRDQGVFALAAGVGTAQAIAASADANAACVPQLFPFGGHPGLANPAGQPWTVGGAMSFNAEAFLWAHHIGLTHPNGATVAMITIDNDYGRAYEDSLAIAVQRYNGLRLVGPFRHLIDGSDAAARVAEAAASGADVIVVGTAAQGCTAVVTATETTGATAARYLSSGCPVDAIGATGVAEGWLQLSGVSDPADPALANDAAVVRYRAAMSDAGIDPTSLSAWSAFFVAHSLVETLRAADARPGGLSRTNLLLAIRSLRLEHAALPSGVALHLNGNTDGHAVEGGALLRYTTGATREPVTVLDLDGQVPACAWDIAALRCLS